jgi:hypothetical protein
MLPVPIADAPPLPRRPKPLVARVASEGYVHQRSSTSRPSSSTREKKKAQATLRYATIDTEW